MVGEYFEFEGITFDTNRGALRTPSGEIALRPKTASVLRLLVDRATQVVEKQELMSAVWPDVVVTDESLAQCISEIRRAVGEDARHIVKTVSRRGYLLTVPVTKTKPAGSPPVLSDSAEQDRSQRKRQDDLPSLAVLPFANLSGQAAQEYFSDGITDDLTTDLSRFKELVVIARDSSFKFKGKHADVREASRQLGVNYVLTGSVQKSGKRVRINAQLTETASGTHLWADRLDRPIADIFAVQDELLHTIVPILIAQVTNAEIARARLRPPTTWRAYDYFMRALDCFRSYHRIIDAKKIYEARELLTKCVRLDSKFARAHALLSATKITTFAARLDRDFYSQEALQSAFDAAREAVDLDPNLPDARAQLGYTLGFLRKHDLSILEFEKAFSLNPNYTDWRFAIALVWAGHAERAVEFARANIKLDPFALPVAQGFLGLALFMSRRHEEALPELQQFVTRAPWHPGRGWLISCYAHTGMLEEARREASALLRIMPDYSINRTGPGKMIPFKLQSDLDHYVAGLRMAGLPD